MKARRISFDEAMDIVAYAKDLGFHIVNLEAQYFGVEKRVMPEQSRGPIDITVVYSFLSGHAYLRAPGPSDSMSFEDVERYKNTFVEAMKILKKCTSGKSRVSSASRKASNASKTSRPTSKTSRPRRSSD